MQLGMFTTFGYTGGNVDCCDHSHETRDEAQACLVTHQNEMRKLSKISSRQIIEIESLEALYEELAEPY